MTNCIIVMVVGTLANSLAGILITGDIVKSMIAVRILIIGAEHSLIGNNFDKGAIEAKLKLCQNSRIK